jgi:hypothetical protein
LHVRNLDAERGAQVFEEYGIVDFADFVMLEMFIDDKPRGNLGGRAAGMTGPDGHNLVEVDIEHDAAEIEQKDIGGSGGEEGLVHSGRLQKTGEAGNRRRPQVG